MGVEDLDHIYRKLKSYGLIGAKGAARTGGQ